MAYPSYQQQLAHSILGHLSLLPAAAATSEALPPPPSPAQLAQTVLALTRPLPQLSPAAEQLKRSIISSVFSTLTSTLTSSSTDSLQPNPRLYHLLDLALGFVENALAPPELALASIEDILETSTVKQAHYIFGYLESRVNRLTVDMLPDRGKGLIFLRMQNNLLRRLSKSLDTVFCGRILCFLSSVFPIAEKSGVNLRGTFNTKNITKFDQFENPIDHPEGEHKQPDEKLFDPDPSPQSGPTSIDPNQSKTLEPDSARSRALKSAADKREFYTRFWSLQGLLSNPPELFKSWNPDQPTSASNATTDPNNASGQPSTPNLKKLKDGISKTLEVFGRMTKKELELGHQNNPSHLKLDHQDGFEQFFFPKFLTKSNLLDLEIADPYFRRQVLTQFLIILQYIRGFSPEERLKRAALPKPNRMSEIPYVYQAKDEAWVLKLSGEVWKTLYATPPHGEIFAMTVQQILIRESSWIMWKAGSCVSFEKPSLDIDPSPSYQRITSNPMNFPHQVGTPALSKLWQNKVSAESIQHLDPVAGVPNLDTLHSKIKAIEKQIDSLNANLATTPPDDPKLETVKSQIRQLQERKAGLSWRALRIAQSSHLQHFGRIGMPADINKLMAMIKEANNRPTSGPPNRPTSTMDASALTPTNLHSLSGEPTPGMMDMDAGPNGDLDVNQALRQSQRGTSQDPSQPDVVMLDGESIMEGEKGEGLTSELDGELISDSISTAPVATTAAVEEQQQSPSSQVPSPNLRPPVPSGSSTLPMRPSHQHSSPGGPSQPPPTQNNPPVVPPHHSQSEGVITILAGGQETKKLSEIDEVIRRMEAEANRSAVGTPTPPPPSSSASNNNNNNNNNNNRNSNMDYNLRNNHHPHPHAHLHHHYFHPSLPNPPLLGNNRNPSNPGNPNRQVNLVPANPNLVHSINNNSLNGPPPPSSSSSNPGNPSG